MKNQILTLICVITFGYSLSSQSDVQELVHAMLGQTPIDENLQELCDEIGGRVTGSEANKKAVDWAYDKFINAGLDVDKMPFTMPKLWLPQGSHCHVRSLDFEPFIVSKYHSPAGSYHGELVYVGQGLASNYDTLSNDVAGKFILVDTDLCLDIDGLFAEYAHAAQVEHEAYQRNVKGIIFMSSRPNKLLYRFLTTKTIYNDIPQMIMARVDAQRCVRAISKGHHIDIELTINAEEGSSFTSHNVIAEIKGATYPDEVVIIGAHIDSWALGTGANDNGCNVAMMIDIARQMKRLDIKPDRTIRFALWNGEEQGYYGSHAYTIQHENTLDNHKMALSVDIGSGAIVGFFTNGMEEMISLTDDVLVPVSGLGRFTQLNIPIIGTDNFDFMMQGVPNLVAIHKPQVYGINYHASSDTYDKVDLHQLKINSAIVAALTLGYANMSQEKLDQATRMSRQELDEMVKAYDLEFSLRMFNVWDAWMDGSRGRAE